MMDDAKISFTVMGAKFSVAGLLNHSTEAIIAAAMLVLTVIRLMLIILVCFCWLLTAFVCYQVKY
jgi:hypothetical protein